MINLKEISKTYTTKLKKHKDTRDKLQEQLDKLNLKISRNKKPKVEDAIKPLALAIQKELKAKSYYVTDIDSIWDPVSVRWLSVKNIDKSQKKHQIGILYIYYADDVWTLTEKDKYGNEIYKKSCSTQGVKWLAEYAKKMILKENL